MQHSSVLDWFTAISPTLTSVLLAVISIVGWRYKQRVEQVQQGEVDA